MQSRKLHRKLSSLWSNVILPVVQLSVGHQTSNTLLVGHIELSVFSKTRKTTGDQTIASNRMNTISLFEDRLYPFRILRQR